MIYAQLSGNRLVQSVEVTQQGKEFLALGISIDCFGTGIANPNIEQLGWVGFKEMIRGEAPIVENGQWIEEKYEIVDDKIVVIYEVMGEVVDVIREVGYGTVE